MNDRVGYITLDRPEKRNALSFELISELQQAFMRAESDESVKVIVLRANGEAFCAGADLGYLQQLQNFSAEENLEDSRHLKRLLLSMYRLNKVIIAQVQGHALAGGCGLATVCDFVYTVPEAKFGYTEVRIGFIPAIVAVFLIRKVGEQRARQLLLSGELVSADVAMQLGLVSQVVAKDALESTVFELAQKLVRSNSGQSMAMTKQLIAEVQSLNLAEGLEYACRENVRARMTDDCRKGVGAFLDKKSITW